MLLCESLIAAATREGLMHSVGPYLFPYLLDVFHGYRILFRAYNEVRRMFW